ncbi:FMN-binding protein [Levilactobacillus zymae]|uniref:FMN-binding protein n=1 Tax=Levilactobacillus zymae TaxID=267363 RepID=UPI0028B2BEF1|nr:FMN-binding protein [Levilactobacillus zymae]MDT6980582.1 FMN-binding protein [Levilactobacillus zymae]
MKKIIPGILSVAVAGAVALDGYWLFVKDHVTAATGNQVQSSASSSSATSSSQASSANTRTATSGTYKNGTYTGKATSTQWGDVQVQAVIKNGKITTINVLEYPNDNQHDKQINSQVLPTYKAEALKKQSAKIQLVSGASETYKGFTGSLQNALDQAEV